MAYIQRVKRHVRKGHLISDYTRKKSKAPFKVKPKKVISIAKKVKQQLTPISNKLDIAGSIRRKSSMPKDIDLVVIPKDKQKIKQKLDSLGDITSEGEHSVTAVIDKVQTNVYFASPKDYGAQLMYATGPRGANISNRAIAKKHKMLLNQHGLFDRKSGKLIASTEHDIYAKLGKSYRPPELRGTPRE